MENIFQIVARPHKIPVVRATFTFSLKN